MMHTLMNTKTECAEDRQPSYFIVQLSHVNIDARFGGASRDILMCRSILKEGSRTFLQNGNKTFDARVFEVYSL